VATLFSDDFNRTTGLGANWAERGQTGIWAINTNRLEAPGSAQEDVLYHATAAYGTADYTVSAAITSGVGIFTGLIGRRVHFGSTDSNGYILFVVGGNPGNVYIYKRVSGAYTQLGGAAMTIAYNIVKLSMQGSTIKAFVDGVEKVSIVDTTFTAAGDAGCNAYGSGSLIWWDDFLVEDFTTQSADTRGIIEPLLTDSLQQPPRGGIYV